MNKPACPTRIWIVTAGATLTLTGALASPATRSVLWLLTAAICDKMQLQTLAAYRLTFFSEIVGIFGRAFSVWWNIWTIVQWLHYDDG